ncbi:MAG TPA: DUF6629 family protein [Gemmatimonadales bacterium]|jgi:hypothetical protein|nr:DUF6629 family protein [Gemmatimonadales bacterium]
MCFSASASFAAAGVVTVAGVAALRGARKPAHLLLGAIPLFFALHQLAEGMLWLALSREGYAAWGQPAMFTFLIVAKVVWPVWVPLSIRALEEDPARRRALSALLALGVVLTAGLAYGLDAYPMRASIEGNHIRYRLDFPAPFRWTVDILYLLVTVLPPLVSSIRMMRWIGVILLASLVFSKIFFYSYVVSVWCFFAALISAMVVLVVRTGRKSSGAPNGNGR